MDFKDRLEFLMLLERDDPSRTVCTLCMVLHQRIRKESEDLVKVGFATPYRPCGDSRGQLKIGHGCIQSLAIDREAVELILRAADCGEKFGLPTNVLRKSFKWEKYARCRKLYPTLSMQARIIIRASSKHLFLRTKYRVEIDTGRSIEDQVRESHVAGCGQDNATEQSGMVRVLNAVYGGRASTPILCAETSYQCRFCPSDMVLEACMIGEEVFAELTVIAYRDLGPRGDHLAPHWQHQINHFRGPDFSRTNGVYLFGSERLEKIYEEAHC